jgi:hypothetical protein
LGFIVYNPHLDFHSKTYYSNTCIVAALHTRGEIGSKSIDTKSSFNGQMPDTISRLIIQKNIPFSNLGNSMKVIKTEIRDVCSIIWLPDLPRFLPARPAGGRPMIFAGRWLHSFEKDICNEKS